MSPWGFSRRRRVGPGGGCFGVEGGGVFETFVGGLNLPGATLFMFRCLLLFGSSVRVSRVVFDGFLESGSCL